MKTRSIPAVSLFLFALLVVLCSPTFGQPNGHPSPFTREADRLRLKQQGPNPDHGSPRRIDSTAAFKHGKVNPDAGNLETIPHWSDSFEYQGLVFKYTMVGTDPKRGSRTTVIPTVIIPMRFLFPDGQVFDASTDIIDGQTAVQGIINSPIFRSYDYVLNGTSVGNTQYGDAFQRANFWNSVSTRSRDYHVLLGQPTVAPTQTIMVPTGMGQYLTDPYTGRMFATVDDDFLYEHVLELCSSIDISPASLPIFVNGLVSLQSGGWAYHTAFKSSRGLQTAIVTNYEFQNASYYGEKIPDVSNLSHEVTEWLNDPFGGNYTPGWNIPIYGGERCHSSFVNDTLEVADPLAYYPVPYAPANIGTFTYHLDDAAFLDFFTREGTSRSVNGQYSFFSLVNQASAACVGHVEMEQRPFEVPGSLYTEADDINNSGAVAGYYIDSQNIGRGYLLDNGRFHLIDFPGARFTVPQHISDSGLVVGYFNDRSGRYHGFSYSNGRFVQIDVPAATFTVAYGTNSAGEITGAYGDAQARIHGFVLKGTNFVTVDTPFFQNTEVGGINDSGTIVGLTNDNSFSFSGFIAGGDGFSLLNLPEARSTFPNDLNNGGMVIGTFEDPNGYQSGFVRVFGNLHTLNTYTFGNNDLNQVTGTMFDFDKGRFVGFVGTLPLHKEGH